MVTVILAVAFFCHFFLPRTEPDIAMVKAKRSDLGDSIDTYKEEILEKSRMLAMGNISTEEFSATVLSNNKLIDSLSKEKDDLQIEFDKLDNYYKSTYFNYPNRRSFMWSLGLGIIISALSIRLMQKSHTTKDPNRKMADITESFMGGVIGAYFFAWILDPVDRLDLPYAWYITLTVLLGVLGAVLGYFLTKARHNKISILKSKIKVLQQMVESLFAIDKGAK